MSFAQSIAKPSTAPQVRRWVLLCALLLVLTQTGQLLHGLDHDPGHADGHCAVCLTGQQAWAVPPTAAVLPTLMFGPVLALGYLITPYLARSFTVAAARAPPR